MAHENGHHETVGLGKRKKRRARRAKKRLGGVSSSSSPPPQPPPSALLRHQEGGGKHTSATTRPPTTITNGPGLPPPPPSLLAGGGNLPDVVMNHIIDYLFTIPAVETTPPRYGTVSFIRDLMVMSGVCYQWRRVVRASPLWRTICEWRFPWVRGYGEEHVINDMVSKEPQYQCIKESSHRSEGLLLPLSAPLTSPWMELWCSIGRCHYEAGLRKGGSNIIHDYMMMAEVYASSTGKCLAMRTESTIHMRRPSGQNPQPLLARWRLIFTHHERTATHYVPLTFRDIYQQERHRDLIVNVMLVNKHTHKKAMVYSSSCKYVEGDSADQLISGVGQRVVIKETGHALDVKAELRILPRDGGGGGEREAHILGLVIDCPHETTHLDFYRWFQSLHWG